MHENVIQIMTASASLSNKSRTHSSKRPLISFSKLHNFKSSKGAHTSKLLPRAPLFSFQRKLQAISLRFQLIISNRRPATSSYFFLLGACQKWESSINDKANVCAQVQLKSINLWWWSRYAVFGSFLLFSETTKRALIYFIFDVFFLIRAKSRKMPFDSWISNKILHANCAFVVTLTAPRLHSVSKCRHAGFFLLSPLFIIRTQRSRCILKCLAATTNRVFFPPITAKRDNFTFSFACLCQLALERSKKKK